MTILLTIFVLLGIAALIFYLLLIELSPVIWEQSKYVPIINKRGEIYFVKLYLEMVASMNKTQEYRLNLTETQQEFFKYEFTYSKMKVKYKTDGILKQFRIVDQFDDEILTVMKSLQMTSFEETSYYYKYMSMLKEEDINLLLNIKKIK